MPSFILKMEKPHYKLYQKQPNYNSFRIFECRYFPYLRKYDKNKFSKRTYPCVFIGYSPIYKGYRCLDPKTKRVYTSWHVMFNELLFPFVDNANKNILQRLEPELLVFLDTDTLEKKSRTKTIMQRNIIV